MTNSAGILCAISTARASTRAAISAALNRTRIPSKWGERFFDVADPDGHELSCAWPVKRS
jgi:hypothetical protein